MKNIHLELIDGLHWLATSPDDKAICAEAETPEDAVRLAMGQHKELVRLRKLRTEVKVP